MSNKTYEAEKNIHHSAVLELLKVRPLDFSAICEHIDVMENAHKRGEHSECLLMTLYRLLENPAEPEKAEIQGIMSSLQFLSGVDWECEDGTYFWCNLVSDNFMRKHSQGMIANTPESAARKVYGALKDHENPRVAVRALNMACDSFEVQTLPSVFFDGDLNQQKRAFKVLSEDGLDAVMDLGYSMFKLRNAEGVDLSSFGLDAEQAKYCRLSMDLLNFALNLNPKAELATSLDRICLQISGASYDFEQAAVLLSKHVLDPAHSCKAIAARFNAKANASLAHEVLAEMRAPAPRL